MTDATHQDHHAGICRCWRCFIQDNFTAIALLAIVVLGVSLVVILMHEQSIEDKYVTWLEGFAGGAFSTWTLSLKGDKPHQVPPNPPQLPQIPQLPQLPPIAVEVPVPILPVPEGKKEEQP